MYVYIYIYIHTLYIHISPLYHFFLLNHHILEATQADVCWITTLLVTHCWPRSPVGGWKNCELQVTGEDKGEWNQPYWEENGIYIIASNCMIYQARIPKLMYNHIHLDTSWSHGFLGSYEPYAEQHFITLVPNSAKLAPFTNARLLTPFTGPWTNSYPF